MVIFVWQKGLIVAPDRKTAEQQLRIHLLSDGYMDMEDARARAEMIEEIDPADITGGVYLELF